MNNIIFLMLGITGTLYIKDGEFRKECNKAIEELIKNIKETIQ